MKRRSALSWLSAALWLGGTGREAAAKDEGTAGVAAAASAGPAPRRIATAWRQADGADHVGIFTLDWAAGRLTLAASSRVPGRAHGLTPLPDGGFVAVANRPGRWLARLDRDGSLMRRIDIESETPRRSFNGHTLASTDGAWLYSTETDPEDATPDSSGWLSVRDMRTLERVAQVRTGGIDPHHLLLAADGSADVIVANGGIPRDAAGKKLDGEPMAPSLVRIDVAAQRLAGRWTLPDPALSVRHLAWAQSSGGAIRQPLLGVALQAEHADPSARAAAPSLALFDGDTLRLAEADTRAGGYAGDIAAGPAGGFVISAQKQHKALWWHPKDPARMTLVADLTEPCGLLAWPDARGVEISAGKGIALWHGWQRAAMLAWPVALAPDNHLVALSG